MAPKKNIVELPVRKEVKTKFSPTKKNSNKFNHAYVTGYKFGLLSLTLKKGTNMTEDAYFKDFIDILDEDPSIAEKLNIIKITSVRKSAKCNIAKTQMNGYRNKQIIGMTPINKENDPEFRKVWAENIIAFLNNEVKWKYENTFRFRADLTKNMNGKSGGTLDECMLDEDIGGFVGAYLFDDVESVKQNSDIMNYIFSDMENYESGGTILTMNWNNWNEE